MADAFRFGYSLEKIHQITRIDPWFLAQIEDLIHSEEELRHRHIDDVDRPELRQLKRQGFSDMRIAKLCGVDESAVRERRHALGLSCLLYTSPSPRDRTRSRMPSSA